MSEAAIAPGFVRVHLTVQLTNATGAPVNLVDGDTYGESVIIAAQALSGDGLSYGYGNASSGVPGRIHGAYQVVPSGGDDWVPPGVGVPFDLIVDVPERAAIQFVSLTIMRLNGNPPTAAECQPGTCALQIAFDSFPAKAATRLTSPSSGTETLGAALRQGPLSITPTASKLIPPCSGDLPAPLWAVSVSLTAKNDYGYPLWRGLQVEVLDSTGAIWTPQSDQLHPVGDFGFVQPVPPYSTEKISATIDVSNLGASCTGVQPRAGGHMWLVLLLPPLVDANQSQLADHVWAMWDIGIPR